MDITCTIDHSGEVPTKAIAKLPKSQGKEGRHRCAACAYLMGRKDAAKAESNLRDRLEDAKARIRQLEAQLGRIS